MDYSTYYAEKQAGVYDDDTGEPCGVCGHYPCNCDNIFDSYRDREFDEY